MLRRAQGSLESPCTGWVSHFISRATLGLAWQGGREAWSRVGRAAGSGAPDATWFQETFPPPIPRLKRLVQALLHTGSVFGKEAPASRPGALLWDNQDLPALPPASRCRGPVGAAEPKGYFGLPPACRRARLCGGDRGRASAPALALFLHPWGFPEHGR